MPETRLYPRFPAAAFVSRAAFENDQIDRRAEHDMLFLDERRLATAEPFLVHEGTCAPCLRPAVFTSATAGGEALPDGRVVPNWREEFVCDCADRLNARLRATLHFLQSETGVSAWTRLLVFGPPMVLERRLLALMPRTAVVRHLKVAEHGYRLEAEPASAHVVLAMDVLHCVPPLDAALAEFRRVLVPGGQVVLTVPFRFLSAGTVSHLDALPRRHGLLPAECAHEVHEIGWDLLDRLRDAGFRRCMAYAYRSEELGYLGPAMMIFSAEA